MVTLSVGSNCVAEVQFESTRGYADPFNEIDLDVVFTDPTGRHLVVPAFWAGNRTWKARYASTVEGEHTYTSACSDKTNADLHGMRGTVRVVPYSGSNPLMKHGPLKVTADGHHLEHADGTPFFWLGDTWWTCLTKNPAWPEEFQELVADRVAKGFTVVQLVAGLLPGLEQSPPLDPFAANEGGAPWFKGFSGINPDFFNYADRKIQWLVDAGLVPCVFGAWGHYLRDIGPEKIRKHWRHLVARWAAYPVVWTVTGEARWCYSPEAGFFDFEHPARKRILRELAEGWSDMARYVKALDPFKRLLTVHPSPGDMSFSSRDIFSDASLFDLDILQTGHCGVNAFGNTLKTLEKSVASAPPKPVVNSECNYEGIMGTNSPDILRFLLWTQMLSGAAGLTYGAWGVMFAYRPEDEVGFEKRGAAIWGEYVPFRQAAYEFQGAAQHGFARAFFEQFAWQKFGAHPEWVTPRMSREDRTLPYAAGIRGEVVVIYIPALYLRRFDTICDFTALDVITVSHLKPGASYQARYYNPRTGQFVRSMAVAANEAGECVFQGRETGKPNMLDWVLAVERRDTAGTP